MTAISKLLLTVTAMMTITNISLAGSKADWALPVLIAIAASPPLRPKKINLLLAICTLMALLLSLLAGSRVAGIVAIISAIACMILGFINRAAAHEVTKA